MDPITIMAIASAAGSLAQLYQSEKARGANQARLKQLKSEYDKLVPPDYNMSIENPPNYISQAVQSPQFAQGDFTPEQFQVVGKYVPEIAPYIAEKNPELIKQSAAANEGRQAQIDALRQMRGISSQDKDPQLMSQLAKASRQA